MNSFMYIFGHKNTSGIHGKYVFVAVVVAHLSLISGLVAYSSPCKIARFLAKIKGSCAECLLLTYLVGWFLALASATMMLLHQRVMRISHTSHAPVEWLLTFKEI